MRTSGPRNDLNERRVRHINNNTACTAPAVRSRWANPSNRKLADIYISTPALRHWEAPRRTTVDARNQPADKRMINRRLKPHRRPCAHFWSGRKSCGVPRGEKSLLPRLLTTDIRGDSNTSSTRIRFSVHTAVEQLALGP